MKIRLFLAHHGEDISPATAPLPDTLAFENPDDEFKTPGDEYDRDVDEETYSDEPANPSGRCIIVNNGLQQFEPAGGAGVFAEGAIARDGFEMASNSLLFGNGSSKHGFCKH